MPGSGELVDALIAASAIDAAAIANVKEFGASGSALATTGTIASGSRDLFVPNAMDFVLGHGISVANAGPAGALLVSAVDTIGAPTTAGQRVSLRDAASTTASNKAVKHNDTAAFVAAFAASKRVHAPAGYYYLSSALTMQRDTHLSGDNGGKSPNDVTTLDFTATAGLGLNALSGVNNDGSMIEDLAIIGSQDSNAGVGVSNVTKIQNVDLVGFRYGLIPNSECFLYSVRQQLSYTNGLLLSGVAGATVINSYFANTWNGPNILISSNASDVLIDNRRTDEAFGGAATILILAANRIRVRGGHIYYTHVGVAGYGIRLGDGTNNPTNCTLEDMVVERFAGNGVAPVAGIELRGSGHVLRNVYVDVSADGGATALSDLTTDGAKMYGVTAIDTGGTHYIAVKDPSLPSASPGAGSKQLWYDPAAANVVKFAP